MWDTSRGISHLLTVAVDLESSKSLTELTSKYDHIYSSVGVHPLQDEELPLPTVEQIAELAKLPKVIAVGETGLDNFYSADSYEWQYESFTRKTLVLPFITIRTVKIIQTGFTHSNHFR